MRTAIQASRPYCAHSVEDIHPARHERARLIGGGSLLHRLVSQFVHDHGFVLLFCCVIGAVIAGFCFARSRRVRERERLAREVEDALVQNAQGVILNVHGIVKNLSASDPMRLKVEQALDRADEQLSEDRDRVQDLRARAQLDDEPPH
jgi:hypothetical protein